MPIPRPYFTIYTFNPYLTQNNVYIRDRLQNSFGHLTQHYEATTTRSAAPLCWG